MRKNRCLGIEPEKEDKARQSDLCELRYILLGPSACDTERTGMGIVCGVFILSIPLSLITHFYAVALLCTHSDPHDGRRTKWAAQL